MSDPKIENNEEEVSYNPDPLEERSMVFDEDGIEEVGNVRDIPLEGEDIPNLDDSLDDGEAKEENSKTSNISTPSSVSKKVFISIDTSPSSVLKLQEEGNDLYFEDHDRFLTLPAAVVEGLNHVHKQRYLLTEHITNGKLDTTPSRRFTPVHTKNPASARSRLSFKGGKPGKAYTWQFGDQLPYLEDSLGIHPCTDPDVKTFVPTVGDLRKITESDNRQLVFCEYDKATREAKESAEREKARRRSESYDDVAEGNLRKAGANAVGRSQLVRETKNLKVRMDEGA